jgi:hypothetical protein
MGSINRFWVVGGEYKDTRFDEVKDGTREVYGPFDSYDNARTRWQSAVEATRCNAYMRFTIAREGSPAGREG